MTITPVSPIDNHTDVDGLQRRLKPYGLTAMFDDENPDEQYIIVKFKEWWQGSNGNKRDLRYVEYRTEDIPEHLDEQGNTIPASLPYTHWYDTLGVNYILPAINTHLATL